MLVLMFLMSMLTAALEPFVETEVAPPATPVDAKISVLDLIPSAEASAWGDLAQAGRCAGIWGTLIYLGNKVAFYDAYLIECATNPDTSLDCSIETITAAEELAATYAAALDRAMARARSMGCA